MESELGGRGNRIGYRQMLQRLQNDSGLLVHNVEGLGSGSCRVMIVKTVAKTEKVLNIFGTYMDGNDKWKPFGFCIHGAIVGFQCYGD